MKEHRHIALFVACGNIEDVEIAGDKLVITTQDKTVLSLLKDGVREIERALSWQGLEIGVEVKEKIILPTKIEEDEAKLKKMFGEKLKIKEE